MNRVLPPRAYLLSVLRYEPLTGALTWRRRKEETPHDRTWNTRYADKPALAHKVPQGYLEGKLLGKNYRAHRVIWKMETGEEPLKVDHKNGRRDDNRWRNLRSVDDTEHAKNCGVRDDNTSGTVGVVFDRDRLRWRAQIGVNGKTRYLGLFDNKTDAIAARKRAEKEHGFFGGHGNRKGYSPS